MDRQTITIHTYVNWVRARSRAIHCTAYSAQEVIESVRSESCVLQVTRNQEESSEHIGILGNGLGRSTS